MCIRDRGKLPLSLNRSSPKTIGLENSTISVSYTHLDVYKRQRFYSGLLRSYQDTLSKLLSLIHIYCILQYIVDNKNIQ